MLPADVPLRVTIFSDLLASSSRLGTRAYARMRSRRLAPHGPPLRVAPRARARCALVAVLLGVSWLVPVREVRAEGRAQEEGSSDEVARVEALAERYLAALRDDDAQTYAKLHATYLERCADEGTADAYEHLAALELRSSPAEPADLRIAPVDPAELAKSYDALAATAGVAVRHPDPPVYVIEVTLEGAYRSDHPCHAPQDTRRVRKYVALRDGRFYLAPACLTEAAVADLRASRRTQRAVRRMQDALYAELDEEEREALEALVAARRGEEAVERYRARSGASRGAAVRLIERLCLDF